MRAKVEVFTFKDGLLARLAHDLRLRLQRFEIRLDGSALHAWFDPRSFVVDGVVRGGVVDPEALDRADRAKIVETIEREILEVDRHPKVEVDGTIEGASVAAPVPDLELVGELRLRGVARGLRVPIHAVTDAWISEVELAPSQFGIKPHRALGGAIRLQDRIRVRVLASRATVDPAAVTQGALSWSPDVTP